jgi:hypothetical protein
MLMSGNPHLEGDISEWRLFRRIMEDRTISDAWLQKARDIHAAEEKRLAEWRQSQNQG